MGLGNIFGGALGDVIRVALPAVGTFFGGPLGGIAGGAAAGLLAGAPDVQAQVAGYGPAYGPAPAGFAPGGQPFFPGGMGLPVGYINGQPQYEGAPANGEVIPAALPAAIPAIMGLTQSLALALARVAAKLGIAVTIATVGRFGLRFFRSLMAWSRRHPAVNIVGFLAALGMATNEIAEFLTWGAMKQRRRRGRGISARDIRTTRRVIRRLNEFRSQVGGGMRFGRARRRAGDGVVVARAG